MRCPICNARMAQHWATETTNTVASRHECPRCGKVDVTRNRNLSNRINEKWHPVCTCNVTMVSIGDGLYTCWNCGRKVEVKDNRLETVWSPYQAREVNA